MASSKRPERSEYAEYYHTYVGLVPDGDIARILEEERRRTVDLLSGVSPERADYRYAPGKWTLKEVLGHVVDMEWAFTYRALSFARGATAPLPDLDQDEFVKHADFQGRELADLLDEFSHLRSANTRLFASLDETALDRRGIASGKEFTARAIPYIIVGHQMHHLRVLRERYLAD